MKKTVLSVATVTSLLLSVPTTSGAEMTHAIVFGAPTCGDWVGSNTHVVSRNVNAAWLLGFISATNMVVVGQTGKELLTNTTTHSITAWMDNFCRENPLNDVAEGVAELYEELANKQ